MIYIESKRKSEKKILEKYPNALILDVTSKAKNALVKLSPFYPHGDIPVPYSEGILSKSVEGIWQALKVFEKSDIDLTTLGNDKMKNIKRTTRKFGNIIGHRKGIHSKELLSYLDARIKIYLPSYLWILTNKVSDIIERLKIASEEQDIVLLDYTTNSDILNFKKPLSHAFLIKAYIENQYPTEEVYANIQNTLKEPIGQYKKSKRSSKSTNTNRSNKTIQTKLF